MLNSATPLAAEAIPESVPESIPRPRAYLIDTSIYIFRAWHIYDTSILDTEGRPVNAVAGFSDFLWQLIRYKRPGLIACAFDESQVNSFRRELYPDYKANRTPAPPDLKRQFALCRQFCQALGLPAFGSDRFEADDIIGSLAARLRAQGYAITVVSADKDLTQVVVAEDDAWWDFARGNILDRRGVKKHFGVEPELIADLLALCGDKVDNIAGVPGVGCKMAAKLLHKYPGIDSVLANIDAIGGLKFRGAARVQALLKAHRERLPLNKRLTSLVTDMDFDHGDLAWRGIDAAALEGLCDSLGVSQALRQRWHTLTTLA